ncbi:MAG: response regulator [Thermotaleaceae bacterium]
MRKILVVEDEKNIVLSLKMLLQKGGYEVIVATDGINALKMAQEQKPDLILLDILLPKLNGYLVCEALKDEMETKHIPIVIISAKTQKEDIDKAFAVGALDYIVKPFTHDQIKNVVNKYLKEVVSNE